MQRASANYFILLDSDCILPDNYLSIVNEALEKDYVDAKLALELKLDYLALSFVRRAADVVELREFLMEQAVIPQRQAGQDARYGTGHQGLTGSRSTKQ